MLWLPTQIRPVRHAIALNSTTPAETAERLITDPEVIDYHSNPYWTLSGLRAEQIRRAAENTLDRAPLPRPTTPEAAAHSLLLAFPVSDRAKLARQTRNQYIARVMCHDAATSVREAAAGNPSTAEQDRSLLAKDPSPKVRAAVVWRTADSDLLAELAREEVLSADGYLPYRVEDNLHAPHSALAEIARRGIGLSTIALHPNASEAVLAELASVEEVSVRLAVSENPNTTGATLSGLYCDTDSRVRRFVAAHRNTPSQLLSQLARDSDATVRLFIAINRHNSDEDLLMLSSGSDVSSDRLWRRIQALRRRPRERFVCDADQGVRQLCIQNMEAPIDTRRDVAGNPNSPPDVLMALAADPRLSVRLAVASNQITPEEALTVLCSDSDQELRLMVARRVDTPSEALSVLAHDKSWRVGRAAASRLRRR